MKTQRLWMAAIALSAMTATATAQKVDHTQCYNYCRAMEELYEEGGDFEKGQDFLEKELTQHPEFIKPYVIFAELYTDAKMYDDAENMLRDADKVAKKKEDKVEVATSYIYLYRNKEDHAKAIEYADKHIKLDSKDYWGYLQKGYILIELEKYAEAKEVLEKGLKISKDDEKTSELQGALARCCYDNDELDKAIEWAQKAIALDPENGYAYRQMAYALTDKNEIGKALDLLPMVDKNLGRGKTFQKIIGGAASTDEKETLSELERRSENDESGMYLEGLLYIYPIYEHHAEFRKTAKIYRDKFGMNDYYYKIGDAFGDEGDYARAEKYFRKCLDEVTPADKNKEFKILNSLANALSCQSKYDEAIELLSNYIKRNADSEGYYVLLSEYYMMKKEIAKSLEMMEKYEAATELECDDLCNYIYLLMHQGKKAKAKEQLEKMRKMEINDLEKDYMALALIELGEKAEAQKIMKEMEEDCEYEFTAMHLAMAYNMLGDKENTRKWLKACGEKGFECCSYIKNDPRMENIHTDPYFGETMKEYERKRQEYLKSIVDYEEE